MRHHRSLGAGRFTRARQAPADQGPQRLVIVHLGRVDDRDVFLAALQQARGDRNAGGAPADDNDLVMIFLRRHGTSARPGR